MPSGEKVFFHGKIVIHLQQASRTQPYLQFAQSCHAQWERRSTVLECTKKCRKIHCVFLRKDFLGAFKLLGKSTICNSVWGKLDRVRFQNSKGIFAAMNFARSTFQRVRLAQDKFKKAQLIYWVYTFLFRGYRMISEE